MAFPQFEVMNTVTEMDIATTISGTTARNGLQLTVTDSSTIASGTNRGFSIDYTNSGAKTGNVYVEDLSATVSGAIDGDFAVHSLYVTQSSDSFTSCNVFLYQAYVEDLGTGVGNVCMIDIGRVMTNANTVGRDCFFRAKGHGGTCGSVFYLEGTGDALATQLATVCGWSGAAQGFVTSTALQSSHSITAHFRVAYEGTPGTVTTQYYIPLYTAD